MYDAVVIEERPAPLGPGVYVRDEKIIPGAPILYYLSEPYLRASCLDLRLNGRRIDSEELETTFPTAGDRLSVGVVPGFLDPIGTIGFVIQWGLWAHDSMQEAKKRRRNRNGREVFGDSSLAEYPDEAVAIEGNRIPIIYGEQRVSGFVVSQFHEKSGDNEYLNTLYALSRGPVEAIDPNGDADCHINGDLASSFSGITITEAVGTVSQAAIGRFDSSTTTSSPSTQITQGGIWGGEAAAITVNGTISCDRMKFKVTFITGLYNKDDRGHFRTGTFQYKYRYRVQAGPGAWSAWSADQTYQACQTDAHSFYFAVDLPTTDTYDVAIARVNYDHNTSQGLYGDSYLKEVQEITKVGMTFPGIALAAITSLATQQLTDDPLVSFLVQGKKIMQMTSATAVSAASYGKNPADVLLDQLFNKNWGIGKYIDTRISVTVDASRDWTLNEEVRGPANDYQFRGKVESFSGTTVVIECLQGLPHGLLTGQSSSWTANVSSLDEAYGVSLTDFWAWHQFCDAYVPDGTGDGSTVNQNSSAGSATLYVAATTAFTAGDHVAIDQDGTYEETAEIQTVNTGVSLTLTTTLTYTHTAVQAHSVKVAEKRCLFDGVVGGQRSAFERIEEVMGGAMCMLVFHGQQIVPVPWKTETPCMLFSEGNIVRGSLSWQKSADITAPNAFDVSFRDSSHDYRFRDLTIEDPAAQTNSETIKSREIEIPGVCRASQITRVARFRLKRARYTGNVVRFRTGRQALNLQVGKDVVWFCHPAIGYGTIGGRAISATTTSITLDRKVTLGASTYTIRVYHADDTQESATVTSAPSTTHQIISISPSTWSTTPSHGDVYALGTLGRFRVIGLRAEGVQAEVTLEEDSTAYYAADPGVVPTWTETEEPDPREIPPDVEDVHATMGTPIQSGSTVLSTVDVTWNKPDSDLWHHAEVWWKHTSGRYWWIGSTSGLASSANGEFNSPCAGCVLGEFLYIPDAGNDRIVKVNRSDGTFSANLGSSGTGDGQFRQPTGVCTDGTYLYVCDSANHRIQTITTAGVYVSKIGKAGPASGNGEGEFLYPWGIAYGNSKVYCADTYNHRVQCFTIVAGVLTYSAKVGSEGSGNDQFERPMGIAVAASGKIILADTGNNRVMKRASNLTYESKIGSNGTGDDQFNFPVGIAVDSAQDLLWVADSWNYRISRRLLSDLSFVAQVGTGSCGDGPDELGFCTGVVYDNGHVYVMDRTYNRVQMRDDTESSNGYWIYKGSSTTGSYTIPDGVETGMSYRIAVVSVSPLGAKEHPDDAPTADITATRRNQTPPDVTGFQARNVGGQVSLTWNDMQCTDLLYYEVRVGVSWGFLSAVVGTTRGTSLTATPPPMGETRAYWIKLITQTHAESATEASCSCTSPWQAPPWNPSWSWNGRS